MKASSRGRQPGNDETVLSNSENPGEPLLFGQKGDPGLVAVEMAEGSDGNDDVVLFQRVGNKTSERREPFKPFVIADINAVSDCPVEFSATPLSGHGRLNMRCNFSSWKDCLTACKWLAGKTGYTASAPGAPYLFLNDPIHQHLISSGRTLFREMKFDDLKRMQVDIECITTPGYEFCNAEREGDRIIAIALGDQTGWMEVISGSESDEKKILERFVEVVRERDPDVLEGHNIFNFDLPYIAERAKRHRVKLLLGRNGSVPRHRTSRFNVAERTLSYERFDIYGRHIVDTLFLVHAYDVSHRELDGFGLKEVAVHFGLAAKNRTYIEGSEISAEYRKDPSRVLRYVRDDIAETRDLSAFLSISNFVQAQILPYSYQNVCIRGNATKIDALMLREYLRKGCSMPMPDEPREFEGGYTDMFIQGVIENVHHCDVRSLYPSLMLSRKLAPAKDEAGGFLSLLETLKIFRMQAKQRMQASTSRNEKLYLDALQAAFKILINSFYGYLGFAQGHFNDYGVAEKVTESGRTLLKAMIDWLKKHGAKPVEIDTDGIYFVPPDDIKQKALAEFRHDFARMLPEGIEIEFDGEYRSMFSYKMKNYALLCTDGEMIIKGAALKSRGLEPFQRDFMREVIRLKLEGRDDEIIRLKNRYENEIRSRKWPIERLAKTENLQDSPSTYTAKKSGGKRPRSAAYELALRSNREYRAGDQVSYYVTGDKKSVAVHENSRLVSDWNPEKRDENVAYYLDKLEALFKKFGNDSLQAEMDL